MSLIGKVPSSIFLNSFLEYYIFFSSHSFICVFSVSSFLFGTYINLSLSTSLFSLNYPYSLQSHFLGGVVRDIVYILVSCGPFACFLFHFHICKMNLINAKVL